MSIIELTNVAKRFGNTQVLHEVSFTVAEGRTTAIVGPSGAGKSVVLRHIVGLERPDSGSVRCLDVELATATEAELYAVRRRLGMLFQDGALFDSMTVSENVCFPLRHHAHTLTHAQQLEQAEHTLEMVGLSGFGNRMPSELSGGQRKRVGLARAVVMRPELVLFDEPNSGLDPMTATAIDDLIVEMKEHLGITFVIISHDIIGTMRVADDIVMIHDGQVVTTGPASQVLRSDIPFVRSFFARNYGAVSREPSLA